MNETKAEQLEIIGGYPKDAVAQFQPSAVEIALKERDRLLEKNKAIVTITTPEDAALVARALKANKAFASAIEGARSEYKAPVLALGRRIDAVADRITGGIESDITRFSKLLGSWQAEQNRLAEEIKRKAYQEEQRLRAEAEEKEREAQRKIDAEARERAERERKEQEALEAKAARARTDAGRLKAEQEAADLRAQRAREDEARIEKEKQEAEERKNAEARKVVDVRIEAATSAPVLQKPNGIATRREIKFTVDDPAALYAANPILVRLVPENALIKAALKNLPLGGKLPGVTHWEEHASHVR
jgi:hypothetical protein